MTEHRAVFGQDWNSLTEDERELVAVDALAILNDPEDEDERACSTVADACVLLRRRMGGPGNLKAYAASLIAGEARRLARVDMSCDSCAAVMVNGHYCHETGCPNARKVKVDGRWQSPDSDEDEDAQATR